MNDFRDTPHRGKKKQTKRWCRGKIDVEHQAEWTREVHNMPWINNHETYGWEILLCQNCGKQLGMRGYGTPPWRQKRTI